MQLKNFGEYRGQLGGKGPFLPRAWIVGTDSYSNSLVILISN